MEKIFSTKKNRLMFTKLYFLFEVRNPIKYARSWAKRWSLASARDSKRVQHAGAKIIK